MKKTLFKLRFILFPICAIAMLSVASYAVMLLWNNILPDVIQVRTVTFWQAMGIFLLCKILFGFGGRGSGNFKERMMARKMGQRFKEMSPEQKEQLRAKMREHSSCFDWRRGQGFCPPREQQPQPENTVPPAQ